MCSLEIEAAGLGIAEQTFDRPAVAWCGASHMVAILSKEIEKDERRDWKGDGV